jgi:acyl-CoA synthetase (AMP-forming)/AMP-acid ligase II/acyl carrier protein
MMNQNITDYLYQHALSKPDEIAFRFLSDKEAPDEITYKQLWLDAVAIADLLQQHVSTGDRVLLLYPSGLAYIIAFYGCLMAGVIAVPLYPPRKNRKSDRIMKVAQSCHASIALTTTHHLPTIKDYWQRENSLGIELSFYPTDENTVQAAEDYSDEVKAPTSFAPDFPAYLQYTSGSTGVPKGVIISHENIVANIKHLSLITDGDKEDIFVHWLPLFHDMGLVTAILWPVLLGTSSVLMAPATFINNPLVWLKAISKYRGSMCGAPNFAFDLCVNKIPDEALSSLDLSCWRFALNGAEPVKAKTLAAFEHKFSACGFTETSFNPCYGLAEATVYASGGRLTDKPKILHVDRKKLADHQLEIMDEGSEFSTAIVGSGVADEPHSLKVVDPVSKTEMPAGETGEIWFAGPSVSSGYWQLEDVSQHSFGQSIVGEKNARGYLRTGDYGVIWDGELYVTGRMKDLIILHGVNYYPQDIEESMINAHEAVRPGYSAAFSVLEDDNEKLVVVTELERAFFRKVDPQQVINAIRQQVIDDHEVNVHRVVLLKPYGIPTTSSGKIQRDLSRQLLNNGEFDVIADSNVRPKQAIIKPQTEVETAVHGIWCSILKYDDVSTTANFFEIGGDSISAIQISAEIDKTYQHLTFDMDELLELATIKDIAQYIELTKLHHESQSVTPPSSSSGKFVL